MRKILGISLICWIVSVAWTGSWALGDTVRPLAEPAGVVVRVASGRTFKAALDRRTDTERLWLRFGEGRIEILRPVDWACVVSVTAAGQELSGVEFRQVVEQVRKEIPVQPCLTVPGQRAFEATADSVSLRSTRGER